MLRMLLAALVILALARPVLNPDRETFTGSSQKHHRGVGMGVHKTGNQKTPQRYR